MVLGRVREVNRNRGINGTLLSGYQRLFISLNVLNLTHGSRQKLHNLTKSTSEQLILANPRIDGLLNRIG
jgi:hypothetical protein